MGAASCVQSYGPRTNGRLDAIDARVSRPASPVLHDFALVAVLRSVLRRARGRH